MVCDNEAVNPLDFLRAHEPFSRLDESGLALVDRTLSVSYASSGERLIEREGAENEFLWIIRKGTVRVEREGRAIDELGEGEYFGYPSLLARGSPQFDVIAQGDVLLYRVPRATFEALLENEDFGRFFRSGLADRLRHASRSEPVPLAGDLAMPVGSLVQRKPVFVGPKATVGEAARVMTEARVSSLLVRGDPLGIVTDRDLRSRVLARGLGPSTPLAAVMTSPARTLSADAPVIEALMRLLDARIHHLPLERDGQIMGVVTHTDLMRHQVKSPAHLLKRIEKAEGEEIEGHANDIAGMVESLTFGGLKAAEVGRIVATLNDALVHAQLLRAERDQGKPPCAYAWIVFGSEGRREQLLLTDQDNALVYATATKEAESYFGQLAERVVGGLIRAGFPPCAGGFMATNWCRPLDAWKRLFSTWVEEPDPQALMDVANFFDFRPIFGTLDLEPLDDIVQKAASQRRFLAQLARASLGMRPPIGLFHRIRQAPEGIDIKAGGLMPIVGLARVHALEAGSRDRSTLARLEAARRAGLLSDEGAEGLIEGFRFLFRLRLETQLKDVRRGDPPDNRVRLEELGPLDARHLKDTLLHIRQMQQAMAQRFNVDMLG